VRLAGIDTSELGSADGFRAALFTAELLEGARISNSRRAVRIVQQAPHRAAARQYGRLLGGSGLRRQGDTLLLQEQCCAAGCAAVHDEPHGKLYYERLNRAAR